LKNRNGISFEQHNFARKKRNPHFTVGKKKKGEKEGSVSCPKKWKESEGERKVYLPEWDTTRGKTRTRNEEP